MEFRFRTDLTTISLFEENIHFFRFQINEQIILHLTIQRNSVVRKNWLKILNLTRKYCFYTFKKVNSSSSKLNDNSY